MSPLAHHLSPPALRASAVLPDFAAAAGVGAAHAAPVVQAPTIAGTPHIAAVPYRARFRYHLSALHRRNLLLRAPGPLPASNA